MNLLLLLCIPLITSLAILPVRSRAMVRWISLFGSVAQLAAAVFLFFAYNQERDTGNTAVVLFEDHFKFISNPEINFHFGVDGIAVAMILLTSFVLVAGVLVSWKIEKMTREFYFLLLLLALGAFGFFISLDLFVLFFFLEISVIPKYLLIGIWGSGKKEYAANKLALMLMGGSALILVGILLLYFNAGHTFDVLQLSHTNINGQLQKTVFPLLFIGFGVFTALFPFHTWVPDGHSSAPTAGSMFLAGISMKLGGYGCLRIATFLLPEGAREYANIIIILSAIAILYGAFATMMQKDLKYINAYSSVSHVGFSLLGIGMLTQTAFTGALLQMVSHGVMTALFFAVIGIIYDRTHTRQVNEMGGLMKLLPFTMTAFFIVGLCSLGLPGLSGFVAEMTVFVGSWENADAFHRIATIAACVSIVVTAVYILRAIGKVAMGPLFVNNITKGMESNSMKDATWNEKLALIILIGGILAIGIMPEWLNKLLKPSAEMIMNRFTGN
ncbi:MAG: NAD(P)H-quinone oxidoreductase chain 4 1 [Bacteroidetes bacterium ADurb.BinA245]|jgi:NADH-quinone oxidoreductase subunit M|nr:NADH-quinone oxidoreductase subunit M [Chitinophagaceae bacterium]OPZ17917.1 MAG: NAD(P)H-quinone oxidoreductase chain 4 1 [Bacteroidetes bacterium ADurb.BinA245]HRF24344.1 NADH-quinone oxidoreductase subunit M [Chitinophagaceae bacterium]